MFNLFAKKHKYLNCPHLKSSIHFFYYGIKTCCANAEGINFYKDYNGEKIDWDYVYKVRQDKIEEINSAKQADYIPLECKKCFEINGNLSDKKIEKFENKIQRLYFQNNMSCNAQCSYCTFEREVGKGTKYNTVPIIKSLIENNILSENAVALMSGGEITISDEFEELMDILLSFLKSKIEILTNGIIYSKSIEKAFVLNRCTLIISLDSGTRETYKAIKKVDCFDKVINNISNYIKMSESAKENITLKYILVDDINDNIQEINSFFNIVNSLGLKNVRIDVDFNKYTLNSNTKVPNKYFDLISYFNNIASNLGLGVEHCNQVDVILKKNKK